MRSAMAFRIQLALQGGGAKIIHLVAALEAIETLQTNDRIEVTRIAGSSAGAIAGSLFAAGVSAPTVKAELRKFRNNLHEFPRPTKFDFFWNVVWKGNALASTSSLKTLLERLFKEKNKVYVGDIPRREVGNKSGPQMMIVSADIYTGKPHIAKDDEFIVTALLDSCAIPFYFRIWKHPRGGLVDGGIFENLPAGALRKDQDQFGPIVALSFSRSPTVDPDSWAGYASSLLDTTLHNSVSRAIQDLAPEQVLPIPTDLSTFDFVRAFSEDGLGQMYDETRRSTEHFFEEFLKTASAQGTAAPNPVAPILGDKWLSENAETMRNLGTYANTLSNVKYDVKSVSYIIQANCLLKPGELFFGNPDVSTLKLVIRTAAEPVHGQKFSMTISPNSGFYGRADLRIVSPSEQVYTPILFPITRQEPLETARKVEKEAAQESIREVLAFFSPMFPANAGPFTLVFTELLKDVMNLLREGREDSLWISEMVRAAGTVEQMDLVLILPKSFGRIAMFPHKDSLNKGVLADARDYDDIVPQGFDVKVWRCSKGNPREPFAVSVLKVK